MPMFSPSSDRDELHARNAPKRGLALRKNLNALLDDLGADERHRRTGEDALRILLVEIGVRELEVLGVRDVPPRQIKRAVVVKQDHLRAGKHRDRLRNPHRSDLDPLSPPAASPLPPHRVPPSPWPRIRQPASSPSTLAAAPSPPRLREVPQSRCPRLRGHPALLSRHAGSRVSPALRMVNSDRTGFSRVRTGSRHPPHSCRLPVKRNSRHRKIDYPRLPRPAHGRSRIADAGSGGCVQHEVAIAVELVPRLRQPASSTRAPKSPFSSQRFREVPQPYHPQRRQAAQARNQTT